MATPELFATELRATGHSSCTAVSKLCSFFAPYLVSSALAPLGIGLVLGVLNLLAAATAQLLPETTQGTLHISIIEQHSLHRSWDAFVSKTRLGCFTNRLG